MECLSSSSRKRMAVYGLCVDYCGLNKISKKDQYPLPLISDLAWYTTEKPAHSRKSTSVTHTTLFALQKVKNGKPPSALIMVHSSGWLCHFGLSTAPATFQWFMNNIFSDLLNVSSCIYLDDILIYSDDMSKHKQTCQKKSFGDSKKHGPLCKCWQMRISQDHHGIPRIHPHPWWTSHVQDQSFKTIVDWPEPRKVKDIQSFLGFANFLLSVLSTDIPI